MLAFCLVFVALFYFGSLGVAIASLAARRLRLAVVLTSPSMGIGVVLALTLTLNRLGLPITSFGLPLLASLGIIAGAWIAFRRPFLPWTDLRPLAIPIAAGSLMAGLPLLMYGFSWAGNSNGDMGIYLGQASNMLHYGFFHVPAFDQLLTGFDAPQALWYWEIAPPNRYGTDVYLAVVAAALHIAVYKVYMFCSVAAFVTLMLAVASLSAHDPALR